MSESRTIKRLLGTCLAVVSVAVSAAAMAQQGHLTVTTIVQKEITIENDAGEAETRLVMAETVVPGERVVYTISFENVGAEAAENVVITNPISESLTYVAGSASNDAMQVEFSVDGGKTFAAANALRVIDNDVDRPATTRDYTHIRWVMQTELEVGATGSASFAAILE